MESPLLNRIAFPPVKNERKVFLPIRSISYKKSLSNRKDLELRQDMLNTMGKFGMTSNYISEQTNSPTRASTNYGTKPEITPNKPHMNFSFHKLSLSSTKNSTRKHFGSGVGSALLPNLRTPQMRPQQNLSQQLLEPQLHKTLGGTGGKKESISAQDDYFQLLFDENRKVFKVEECEGVDEYYTDNMIMQRIYKQGFREPQYFSTRLHHSEMQIPDERTIREDYQFRPPPLISVMENENTLASYLMGGTWNHLKFIESLIEAGREEIERQKAEKKRIESDIASIKKRFEEEIKNINADFAVKFERLTSIIKEDFIANQNDNFKYQKEIMLLKREKLSMEKEIEESLPILHKVEDILFGREVFNLEPNDARLDNISAMNLRSERAALMKNNPVIH